MAFIRTSCHGPLSFVCYVSACFAICFTEFQENPHSPHSSIEKHHAQALDRNAGLALASTSLPVYGIYWFAQRFPYGPCSLMLLWTTERPAGSAGLGFMNLAFRPQGSRGPSNRETDALKRRQWKNQYVPEPTRSTSSTNEGIFYTQPGQAWPLKAFKGPLENGGTVFPWTFRSSKLLVRGLSRLLWS